MTKSAWSAGFEVAASMLENEVGELRNKTSYYHEEQNIMRYRQDYETKALEEILHERNKYIKHTQGILDFTNNFIQLI